MSAMFDQFGGDELQQLIAEWVKDHPERQAMIDDAERRAGIVDELLAARRAAGLKQKHIAKAMGVKQPTISGFEAESSDPHLSTLQRYARAIGGRIVIEFVPDPPVEPTP